MRGFIALFGLMAAWSGMSASPGRDPCALVGAVQLRFPFQDEPRAGSAHAHVPVVSRRERVEQQRVYLYQQIQSTDAEARALEIGLFSEGQDAEFRVVAEDFWSRMKSVDSRLYSELLQMTDQEKRNIPIEAHEPLQDTRESYVLSAQRFVTISRILEERAKRADPDMRTKETRAVVDERREREDFLDDLQKLWQQEGAEKAAAADPEEVPDRSDVTWPEWKTRKRR